MSHGTSMPHAEPPHRVPSAALKQGAALEPKRLRLHIYIYIYVHIYIYIYTHMLVLQ